MRDKRFIAQHRGGPLGLADHRLLAAWAADCAEHAFLLLGDEAPDDRLVRAVQVARAWARGEVSVGEARQAAVAAHAAAREATNPVAVAVARAVGHAVAVAHMADHCLGPVVYARKAAEAAGVSAQRERDWQIARVPAHLRELIVSALSNDRFNRRSPAALPGKGGHAQSALAGR